MALAFCVLQTQNWLSAIQVGVPLGKIAAALLWARYLLQLGQDGAAEGCAGCCGLLLGSTECAAGGDALSELRRHREPIVRSAGAISS
jgi:hypothetical protein